MMIYLQFNSNPLDLLPPHFPFDCQTWVRILSGIFTRNSSYLVTFPFASWGILKFNNIEILFFYFYLQYPYVLWNRSQCDNRPRNQGIIKWRFLWQLETIVLGSESHLISFIFCLRIWKIIFFFLSLLFLSLVRPIHLLWKGSWRHRIFEHKYIQSSSRWLHNGFYDLNWHLFSFCNWHHGWLQPFWWSSRRTEKHSYWNHWSNFNDEHSLSVLRYVIRRNGR